MNQAVDIHPVSIDAVFDFFQSRVDEMRPASQKNYHIVITSLKNFAPANADAEILFSYPTLSEWVIKLALKGTTASTLRLYINLLSGLHTAAVKAELLADDKPFKLLRQRLDAVADAPSIAVDALPRLLALAKTAANRPVYADLLILAIAAGAIDPEQAAMLTRTDIPTLPEPCREVAQRHADPRRKFVFPLSQSRRTPRQLHLAVENGILYTLAQADITPVGTAHECIQALWALAAMATGASAAQAVATLGTVPAALPILAISDPAPAPDASLRQAVAQMLCANPPQWFAMRLRRGIKINQIHHRISHSNAPRPDIFYPCDEIARRVGRKIVTEQQPILPDIAFFRSPITDIRPLFNTIGDLAWCFKHRPDHSGQYAPIPRAQMELFQQTINQFTPDYQVAPVGQLPLQPGDTVIILGGIYTGYTGTVETLLPPTTLPVASLARAQAEAESADPTPATADSAQRSTPPQAVIYRILLDTGTGFEWRAPIDARLLRKE